MTKADMTPMMLMIVARILREFPKYQYVQVQAWQYPPVNPKSKTLKIMIEVTTGE